MAKDPHPPEPSTSTGGVNIGDVHGGIHESTFVGGNLIRKVTQVFIGGDESRKQRNREILLERVRISWVEGVLEKSIYKAALIELGKEVEPGAVEHPWEKILETPDRPRESVERGKKTIDLFDEVGRELLVLGEPGSGKTMTLLELARDAIGRARDDPRQPVPVIVNLSSWAERGLPMVEWLTEELSDTYHIPKWQGRAWVEKGDLLLLLDGLDEVVASRREACVAAINHLLKEYGCAGVVVASRLEEYRQLGTRLKLYAAVRLKPLNDQQVRAYLNAAGPGLVSLHSALDRDSTLQDLARSPLMLSVMTLAYAGDHGGGSGLIPTLSAKAASDQLFSAYVSRMLERRPGRLASPEETRRRLGWLARRMAEHGRSVFQIEDLQPSWLASRKERWFYAIVSRLACGFVPVAAAIPLVFWPDFAAELEEFGELFYGLVVVVLVVMLAWLALGVKDGFRFSRKTPRRPWADKPGTSRISRLIFRGLCWSLAGLAAAGWMLLCAGLALVYGAFEANDRLTTSLSVFFLALAAAGPAAALLKAWRRWASDVKSDIQTTEKLGWEWRRFLWAFLLVGALPAVLIFALATLAYEPGATLWDSQTGDVIADLAHEGPYGPEIAFNPDGSSFVTQESESIRAWDTQSGRLLCQLGESEELGSSFDDPVFSPDGQRLLVRSGKGTWLQDTRSCDLIAELEEASRLLLSLTSPAFNRDSSRIIAEDLYGESVSLWDGGTGKLIAILGPEQQTTEPIFSPDGNRVATGSSFDFKIRIWDARNGRLLLERDGHTSEIQGTTFSADGTRLLTYDKSGVLRLWDGRDGRPIATLAIHSDFITYPVFSPDSTRILTITDDSENLARLWDSRDGHLVSLLKGHKGRLYSASFSPDSHKILTSSSDGTARVWDGHNGDHLATLEGHSDALINAVFSPDGRRIMTVADDDTVLLWRTDDGRVLPSPAGVFRRKLTGKNAIFSPDGSRIVTTSFPSDLRPSALVWLLVGLAVAILLGVRQWRREVKMSPNEGIRLTARAGVLLGLVGGTMAVLTFLVLFLIIGWELGIMGPSLLTAFWLVSILIGLGFGGFDFLQHLVLRLLLRHDGRVPWRYAQFLDQAAHQILLRKVGGGYIFIHRLLLEHLARTEQRASEVSVPTAS